MLADTRCAPPPAVARDPRQRRFIQAWHGECKRHMIGTIGCLYAVNTHSETYRMATKQSRRKSSSRKSTTRAAKGDASRKSAAKSPSRTRARHVTRRGAGAQSAKGRGGSRTGTTRQSSLSPSRGRKASGAIRRRAGPADALKLLKEDHDAVDAMFRKYDRMKEGDQRKAALREQILEELRVHAQVEEELFYPTLNALFEQGGNDKALALLDEAGVEHETVKWLIEQLEGGHESDEGMSDARIKVLGEYVRHHVEEEEGPIFRAARKADLDLQDLGRRIDARKRQLKGEAPAESEGESTGGGLLQIDEPAAMASGRTAD
jgi:hemerythrin-like domain-containing protein